MYVGLSVSNQEAEAVATVEQKEEGGEQREVELG